MNDPFEYLSIALAACNCSAQKSVKDFRQITAEEFAAILLELLGRRDHEAIGLDGVDMRATASISARFQSALRLTQALEKAKCPYHVDVQTFLYPKPEEARQIIAFLVESLPNTQPSASEQPVRLTKLQQLVAMALENEDQEDAALSLSHQSTLLLREREQYEEITDAPQIVRPIDPSMTEAIEKIRLKHQKKAKLIAAKTLPSRAGLLEEDSSVLQVNERIAERISHCMAKLRRAKREYLALKGEIAEAEAQLQESKAHEGRDQPKRADLVTLLTRMSEQARKQRAEIDQVVAQVRATRTETEAIQSQIDRLQQAISDKTCGNSQLRTTCSQIFALFDSSIDVLERCTKSRTQTRLIEVEYDELQRDRLEERLANVCRDLDEARKITHSLNL